MVTVHFLRDYGTFTKGQESQIDSPEKLKSLRDRGIIEVVKGHPEKAIAPAPEKAVITAPEVHTRTTAKPAKKKK